MEFYISSQGKKLGPLSLYRVTELLRDKEISAKDLGWVRDQEKWMPLEEMPALESTIRAVRRKEREQKLGPEVVLEDVKEQPAPDGAKSGLPVSREVQPFARFWARWFDYFLVSALVVTFVEVPTLPQEATLGDFWSQFRAQQEVLASEAGQKLLMMLLIGIWSWQLVEGILIWLFGTTPGKALFGIRVTTQDGSPVPIFRAMGRSIYVFVAGFGMGINILQAIAMAAGFFRLLAKGNTFWDQHLKLKTHHAPMGLVRILVAVGAFFALMAAYAFKVS
ncbi:MAG: RDD family protein [Verrucomicrobiales bacterium]|nr:RDD family protein [Verrucomicrobiales bacterium]